MEDAYKNPSPMMTIILIFFDVLIWRFRSRMAGKTARTRSVKADQAMRSRISLHFT